MNFSLKNEKQFKKCLSLKTVLRDQFRTIYKPVQKVKKPVIFEVFYKISNILNYTLHLQYIFDYCNLKVSMFNSVFCI